jgi:hypothetical protein
LVRKPKRKRSLGRTRSRWEEKKVIEVSLIGFEIVGWIIVEGYVTQ